MLGVSDFNVVAARQKRFVLLPITAQNKCPIDPKWLFRAARFNVLEETY